MALNHETVPWVGQKVLWFFPPRGGEKVGKARRLASELSNSNQAVNEKRLGDMD